MNFLFATEGEIRLVLASRLRQQRLFQKLTQLELSIRAGIGIATLQRFEKSGECSLENFIRIVIALGAAEALQELFEPKVRSIAEMEQAEKSLRQRAPRKPATSKPATSKPTVTR